MFLQLKMLHPDEKKQLSGINLVSSWDPAYAFMSSVVDKQITNKVKLRDTSPWFLEGFGTPGWEEHLSVNTSNLAH